MKHNILLKSIKSSLKSGSAAIVLAGVLSISSTVQADQVILDDLIVDGSICAGQDCVNGESFGFDTIRIKENNLRIRAVDTSNSASFPSRDWQITFNDSSNGGANKFSIDDIDGGRTPFTIEAGAPSHSLYVDDGGRLGFGTSTPVVQLHLKDGNTPTLRLEQDGSSGFTPQTWDVAGNEANFFVRDATNGSTLPFKILPGAPSDAIVIEASTGDVGVGTKTPDFDFEVERTGDSAYLVATRTDGAQTSLSAFSTSGNVGTLSDHPLNFRANNTTLMTLLTNGNFGIGTSSPTSSLHISGTAGTAKLAIEEANATSTPRGLLSMINNGGSYITMSNTETGKAWYIAHQDDAPNQFLIQSTDGGQVFKLGTTGNLEITGTLTTAGTTCSAVATSSAGCDKVFSKGFQIESIEDHAAAMWKNQYLPAVGQTIENEPFNITKKTGGMLNELEKAHIYIEQLNKQLTAKNGEISEIKSTLFRLEEKISLLEKQ